MRDGIVLLGAEVPSGRAVAKKLRTEHYYCKLMASTVSLQEVADQSPAGILLAGEAGEGAAFPSPALLSLGVPVLALGSSARALCASLGTQLEAAPIENQVVPVLYKDSPIFDEVATSERWIGCAETFILPEPYRVIAEGEGIPLAYADEAAKIYFLQFQIERNDPDGMAILLSFARTVCGLTPWWLPENIISQAESQLRHAASGGTAVCAMSGGLDSTVAAMLAKRALGDSVRCVFVDTGLLRAGEADEAERYFREGLQLNFTRMDASERILPALTGLTTTNEKWRVIEEAIADTLQEEAASIPDFKILVKGTNYIDIIGDTRPEYVISAGEVIEPLRELFKSEVRMVGEALSLSPAVLDRQPFPGMGLAARVHGEVTPERLHILRIADSIFTETLREAGQEKRLSRYFCMLDRINGQDTVVLRATQGSEPTMIAGRLPYDLLERTVEHIQKQLPTVVRVLYDMTPGLAEWL